MEFHVIVLLFTAFSLSKIRAELYDYYGMAEFFPENVPNRFARMLPLSTFETNDVFTHRRSVLPALRTTDRRQARKITKVSPRTIFPTFTPHKNSLDISLSIPVERGQKNKKDEYGEDSAAWYHQNPNKESANENESNTKNDNNNHSNVEAESKGASKSQNLTILNLIFASNFTAFDPRHPKSLFLFPEIEHTTRSLQDNAAFLYDKKNQLIDMVSVPFSRWFPQSFGIAAALAAYDGAVKLKQPIDIADGSVLKVTHRFRCRTINTRRSKFPKEAIENPEDDPRLAGCALDLSDAEKSGLEFSMIATNKGVWARYVRGALNRVLNNVTYDAFVVMRRVATRDSYNELITARIEVDNNLKQTRYYVNDEHVWVVTNWGVLSKDLFPHGNKRNRLVSFSAGNGSSSSRRAVSLSKMTLYLDNLKNLDEADPNKFDELDGGQYSPALVRVVDLPNFYDPNVQFFDEKSDRFSNLWGQGVVRGLHSLLVEVQQQRPPRNHPKDEENEQANDSSKSESDADDWSKRAKKNKTQEKDDEVIEAFVTQNEVVHTYHQNNSSSDELSARRSSMPEQFAIKSSNFTQKSLQAGITKT